MNAADHAFLRDCAKYLEVTYDLRDTLAAISEDAGYDFESSSLTVDDLAVAADGGSQVDWKEVGFVFNEVLCYYTANSRAAKTSTSRAEIICWMTATFLLRDAIRNGYSSWDIHIKTVLQYLVGKAMTENIDPMYYLQRLTEGYDPGEDGGNTS